MAIDPSIRDHKAWLGYLQPDGLVVSSAALVDAQVLLNTNVTPLQRNFLDFVDEIDDHEVTASVIRDLPKLFTDFLEWPHDCLYGLDTEHAIPEELKISLREFGETLEPTFAFRDPHVENENQTWLLLIQELEQGQDLDKAIESARSGWSASPSRRFERLLRESGVPIGIISNSTHIRLIYAPRGENAGTLTFPVSAMSEIAGRPILSAFEMLLSGYRLISAPSDARLAALLERSRKYQSRVSAELAQQVLDALYELLRGFQAADERTQKELLQTILEHDSDQIYAGLLTVLMRLVFLLYAEDRGLMPGSDLYIRHYSVHGLYDQLRNDAEHYPDTMDQRYGAWAQFVALFRLVYDGCRHPLMKMPARHGHLFDPERYAFLEGNSLSEKRLPLVSDGVIFRVLNKLMILGGERLSYRTLDVEQIGSVYETMMGFSLELTEGRTIALKPAKASGAPVPVNLESLLDINPSDRSKWITNQTDYKLPTGMTNEVKDASTIDDLLAALERRIARNATPQLVPNDTMVLMPTDERRKTGSHYTPRSFTEPIVAKTLEPILKQLGVDPTPDLILELKVCDPAMGSGAFLVEACRQLGDELVKSWHTHGLKPFIPHDEDEVLHARRLVAQKCLYGVDRNPMAVDLAKLSLWLATLAKDHPFTFLDHSFKSGDSLVGLTKDQITSFHWDPKGQRTFLQMMVKDRLEAVSRSRRVILSAGDDMPPDNKLQKLEVADEALSLVRLAGDCIIAAFFKGKNKNQRNQALESYLALLNDWVKNADANAREKLGKIVDELHNSDKPVMPFHWHVEFPEVFDREGKGFDAIIGNPPFAGKNTLINSNRDYYLDWLKQLHEESHGNADLVAHFFRRVFNLIRNNGDLGLIATNTIRQGDTRSTGLRYICTHGGTIYTAKRRVKWPGQAAVIVSIVHIFKGGHEGPFLLDNIEVPMITAYLFHAGGHETPEVLTANKDKSFQGSILLGMGFTFDDTGTNSSANSLEDMSRLIQKDKRNAEMIFPYIGGEEVCDSPAHEHHRYAIDFYDISLEEASKWPDLLKIVREKVKPERDTQKRDANRERWWQYAEKRPGLHDAIHELNRVLVNPLYGSHLSFVFMPAKMVFANKLNVMAFDDWSHFAVLQSRVHEIWARMFSSTLKDDLAYTPTDCFETFALPGVFEGNALLEQAGKQYYEYRAELMVKNNEGLTKTYNRFHDPSETMPEIIRLRELHEIMDRAVLDAYGWGNIQPQCGFFLDYEEDEDEESTPSRRKKPWRYRWPDEIHDEVLARLLDLNAKRAEEERRVGLAADAAKKEKTKRSKKKKTVKNDGPKLFS